MRIRARSGDRLIVSPEYRLLIIITGPRILFGVLVLFRRRCRTFWRPSRCSGDVSHFCDFCKNPLIIHSVYTIPSSLDSGPSCGILNLAAGRLRREFSHAE